MSGLGPLGGAPLGGLPSPLWDLDDFVAITALAVATLPITEFMSAGVHADIESQHWKACFATAAIADTAVGEVLANLIDRANAIAAIDLHSKLAGIASDTLQARDVAVHSWQLALADSGAIAATAIGIRVHMLALADALLAACLADGKLTALVDAAAEAVIQDVARQGWSLQAADTAAFGAAVVEAARYYANLLTAVTTGDEAVPTVRISLIAADAVHEVDTIEGQLSMLADLEDEVVLYLSLSLGGSDYSGWVLNTKTKAPSEYRNTPFESLATYKGRTFGGGDGGLFELVGADDAGENISAFVRTGLMKEETTRQKRSPDIFFTVDGAGRFLLKVVTTRENGEKVEDWYLSRADDRTGTGLREGRFEIGKGLKSRYWQFTITNLDGDTLNFTDLQWRPVLLDRRR